MSYIFLTCNNTINNCSYNTIEQKKYFDYLKSVVEVNDETLNKFVCGDKTGEIEKCCKSSTNDESNVYAKKEEGGYYVCKCPDDNCRNIFCKDYEKVDKYKACQLNGNDVNRIVKVNDFVDYISENNFIKDCPEQCK